MKNTDKLIRNGGNRLAAATGKMIYPDRPQKKAKKKTDGISRAHMAFKQMFDKE